MSRASPARQPNHDRDRGAGQRVAGRHSEAGDPVGRSDGDRDRGDAWRYPFHGGRRKAVLLVTSEGIDELGAQGFPFFPGALGENLTTRGLIAASCASGSAFGSAKREIELTQIRTPCATLDVYGPGIQAAITTRGCKPAIRSRRDGA